MERLKIRNASTMVNLIQDEIHRNNDSRYDHRLHGILLVAKGHTCSSVADLLDHSVTTIENWVNRFNNGGFQALLDEPRTGRPSFLSDQQLMRINQDLREDPKKLGYNQNLWDGKLLSYHILNRFEISLSVRQCQRLFHKLGFRQRIPRPISSKSDPCKQDIFKKTH